MPGLQDREEKRKKSVIGAMIDNKNDTTEQVAQNEEVEHGIIIKPKKKEETRSKRVNLLIKPSVYQEAQEKCKKMDISINECVNQFLENWVKEESKF